jgi:Fe-S oxidoreductase
LASLAREHGREHVPALVHGHCHQKALSGMDAPLAALRAAGLDARGTGAGCCGLAGGFGYEADHVEVSRAVAEDRLAPAVRAASGDTVIVAAGTSCRHQIEHVTGRPAVHPAQALADALGV